MGQEKEGSGAGGRNSAAKTIIRGMDEVKQRAASGRSQRVTGADIEAGRIRVPVTTETKSLLPPDRTRIEVVLKGVRLGSCAYNPRYEGSHERSGVITIDKDVLREHVAENEVLPLTVNQAGVVYI